MLLKKYGDIFLISVEIFIWNKVSYKKQGYHLK